MNHKNWRKRWVKKENAYRVKCVCGRFIGYSRDEKEAEKKGRK